MCDPVSLTIAATAVAAIGQGYAGLAANSSAKYEARVAEVNRGVEIRARDDARERGEIAQLQHWRRVSQQYGQQKAQQAASGLDTNFGSPADLLGDVMEIGGEDSATIAENTVREMRGYEVNAANYVMQGRAARSRGKGALIGAGFGMASTILSGATQVSKLKAQRASAASPNFGG